MPHQVTVTAQTGPARQMTAAVVPNVVEVLFQPDAKVLRLRTSEVNGNNKDFDLSAATTVTCTITAGNYAFVVS
jgi:hypothetical protein